MKMKVKGTKSDAIDAAECGCAVREAPVRSRKALGVDPEVKSRNLTRLRRIEGQVRGLQKMVDEDRYCADILRGYPHADIVGAGGASIRRARVNAEPPQTLRHGRDTNWRTTSRPDVR